MQLENARNSNAKVIYTSTRKLIEYSLIEIAPNTPFRLDYTKTRLAIDFSLTRLSLYKWLASGTIDPDTYQNLSLPIFQRRDREFPPIVTDQNIQDARTFGDIEEMGKNDLGDKLYNIALKLPTHKIYDFFHRVWHPDYNQKFQDTRSKSDQHIQLGNKPGMKTVLPQKISLKDPSMANLKVVLLGNDSASC